MKVFRIVLWAMVTLILLSILISLIATSGRFGVEIFSISRDRAVVFDQKYENNIEDLDLRWLSGEVNIYESGDEYIRIIQKSSGDLKQDELVSVQVTGSSMRIDERMKRRIYFFNIRNF